MNDVQKILGLFLSKDESNQEIAKGLMQHLNDDQLLELKLAVNDEWVEAKKKENMEHALYIDQVLSQKTNASAKLLNIATMEASRMFNKILVLDNIIKSITESRQNKNK